MHPWCGRSLKLQHQTQGGPSYLYCCRVYTSTWKPFGFGIKLYIYICYYYCNDQRFHYFSKSLSLPKRQTRKTTTTWHSLSNRTRQTTHNRDVVISQERFGGAYYTYMYRYSNTANLGVRRTQETALPTDRVVFIMNVHVKKKNHPLAPATDGHRRR